MNSKEFLIKKNEKVMFLFGKKNSKNIKKIQISKPLPNFKKPKNFSVSDGKYIFKFVSRGKNYVMQI